MSGKKEEKEEKISEKSVDNFQSQMREYLRLQAQRRAKNTNPPPQQKPDNSKNESKKPAPQQKPDNSRNESKKPAQQPKRPQPSEPSEKFGYNKNSGNISPGSYGGITNQGSRSHTITQTFGGGNVVSGFERIDDVARKTSPDKGESYKDFAERLCKNLRYQTTLNRIRVIYSWIQYNIKYDYDSVVEGGMFRKDQSNLDYIFEHRMAVCLGLSRLFKAMVEHACQDDKSIKFEVEVGMSKTDFQCLLQSHRFGGHAWNSIIYGGNKFHFDVTQGGSEYYMISDEHVNFLYLTVKLDNGNDSMEEINQFIERVMEESGYGRIIDFCSQPCLHPTFFKNRMTFHSSASPFFKESNVTDVSGGYNPSNKSSENNPPSRNRYTNIWDLDKKKKGPTEPVVFSSERSNVDFVVSRIRYKDDLTWNPMCEDDKLGVIEEDVETTTSLDGRTFTANVPVTYNPYNKRYGIVHFYVDGILVWEYCLVFKN